MTLTLEDLEEARVVAEDLELLTERWSPELDTAELRLISTALRRLLPDGQFGRAWRKLGLPGEPYIPGSDLEAMLGSLDRDRIQLAFAPPSRGIGQVMRRGGQVQLGVPAEISAGSTVLVLFGEDQLTGPILYVVPPGGLNAAHANPQQEVVRAARSALGKRVIRGMPLTQFLHSPAALVLDTQISRQDMISYVANKLGGAHFDRRRDGKNGARFQLLDRAPSTYIPTGGRPASCAYVEVLSIAESLRESTDATRFCDTFAREARRAQQE